MVPPMWGDGTTIYANLCWNSWVTNDLVNVGQPRRPPCPILTGQINYVSDFWFSSVIHCVCCVKIPGKLLKSHVFSRCPNRGFVECNG